MKKVIILALLPVTFLACKPEPPIITQPPVKPPIVGTYDKLITNESDFIMAHQLDDGALSMSSKKGIRAEQYLKYVQSFTDSGNEPTANGYNLVAAFVILTAKKMN